MTLHPPPSLIDTSPNPNRKSFLGRYIHANVEWYRFRVGITGLDVVFGSWGIFWAAIWVYKVWVAFAPKTSRAREVVETEQEDDDPFQQHVVDMAMEMGVEIDEKVFMG